MVRWRTGGPVRKGNALRWALGRASARLRPSRWDSGHHSAHAMLCTYVYKQLLRALFVHQVRRTHTLRERLEKETSVMSPP